MSDLNAGGDFSFRHLNIHRALVGASQTAGVHELDLIDSLRELTAESTDKLVRAAALHGAGGGKSMAGVRD